MACLIKPQFEAGREKVGKKGVVRDPAVHREVIEMVSAHVQKIGFEILGLDFSPVKGPEGNIEYLLYIEKQEAAPYAEENSEVFGLGDEMLGCIARVVEAAHEALD